MSCLIENNTYNVNNTLPNFGVVGTDGVVPNYNPNGVFHIWSLTELFNGTVGAGRYVPKLNDYAVDPITFTWYIVDHIDPVTLIPTLRQIHPTPTGNGVVGNELFGQIDECCDTYRLYIDKSVTPYLCCIDIRFGVPGTMATYAKVFVGPIPGRVISKMYDTSGGYIGENVPLQNVIVDNHTNYTYKTVVPFYSTDNLIDGEYVTLVVYSDVGQVMYKKGLVVLNSAYIRNLNVGQKYVSHIHLESIYLSQSDPTVLNFPLNIPTNAMDLWGVVNYSDGSSIRLPVNSGKFTLLGIDQYLSSIIGQQLDLVLRYSLDANETSYVGGSVSGDRFVAEPYKLVTVNPNNSYVVKLFAYPVLDANPLNGYRLKWYLLNLDRSMWVDVTSHISYSANTGGLDPIAYGLVQRKQVSINLRDVSLSFKSFTHTQIVEIQLMGLPSSTTTPWLVKSESLTTKPLYGLDLKAKATINSTIVTVSSGISTVTEWLNRVYVASDPLINPALEVTPIQPTHFLLVYDGVTTEVSIDNWNMGINIGRVITLYSNIDIVFIRRNSVGDMYLSIASMVIYPV